MRRPSDPENENDNLGDLLNNIPEIRQLFAQHDSATGLEEAAARERMRGFLKALGAKTPIVIGEYLQEQDPRFRAMVGLEDLGIYQLRGDKPALFAKLIGQDVRHFLFAGLEEEAQALRPLARRIRSRMSMCWSCWTNTTGIL